MRTTQPVLFTTGAASRYVGLSAQRLGQLYAQGVIFARRIPGTRRPWVVTKDELDRFLARRMKQRTTTLK